MFLKLTNKVHDGVQYEYTFPNGYGASVIKHSYSYGGKDGKWELAVLKDDELCYDTSITNDVLGHLTTGEVNVILDKIRDLDIAQ